MKHSKSFKNEPAKKKSKFYQANQTQYKVCCGINFNQVFKLITLLCRAVLQCNLVLRFVTIHFNKHYLFSWILILLYLF